MWHVLLTSRPYKCDMQDHYDVKMPCHLLLAKLAAAAPGPVLASLERLVGPLEKTLTTRLRGEPVKQEVRNPSGLSMHIVCPVCAVTQTCMAWCYRCYLTLSAQGIVNAGMLSTSRSLWSTDLSQVWVENNAWSDALLC